MPEQTTTLGLFCPCDLPFLAEYCSREGPDECSSGHSLQAILLKLGFDVTRPAASPARRAEQRPVTSVALSHLALT